MALGRVCFALMIVSACALETEASPDGEHDDAVGAGKADGSDFSACELAAVVSLLNAAETSAATLKSAGVHSRAATSLVTHRDGADEAFGTSDDDRFGDIAEVDAVPWVGAAALRQLVEAAKDRCAGDDAAAVFSPQPLATSHLTKIASSIDEAERSIDIGIYSLRNTAVLEAMRRAAARGVKIRVVFDGASVDRARLAGSTSAKLEDMGIEVRWVNLVHHHKFAIIDGPHTDATEAETARLVTGSGNWSDSAATLYNENTLFLRRQPELVLRYQREFNRIWEASRPIAWNESIPYFTTLPIDDDTIATYEDPSMDAMFTSANFRTTFSTRYGHTWGVDFQGPTSGAVASRYIEAIMGAREEILIAQGHMRSRPIVEALLAKHAADPDVRIRVYLDGQEYSSESAYASDLADLAACATRAETEGFSERERWECESRGMRYAYMLHEAGIDVRFKYFAYYWHASFAQMHHKYLIVDGDLFSGSYNLSFNSEFETFENSVRLEGEVYAALVESYRRDFETLWETGRAGQLEGLLASIRGGGAFPIVFDPMALGWEEIAGLKAEIARRCTGDTLARAYEDPVGVRWCNR
jgi:phosphatidylserine/phosphatidylglycerophosphate/cardiolipin synthase-like enzyme